MPHNPRNRRDRVRDPLAVTPTVSPTTGQGGLAPGFTGAAPPLSANRTALSQLGRALTQLAPNLGSALQARLNRLDQEALTAGDIEAQRAGAEANLAVINEKLKEAVDRGELSSGQLPVALKGAAIRIGVQRAKQAGSTLYGRLEETTQVTDKFEQAVNPEDVIGEAFSEALQAVPDDPEAQEAFSVEFNRVADAFRRDSLRTFAARREVIEDQTRAERLDDLLTAYTAASSSQDVSAAASAVAEFVAGNTANGGYKTEVGKRELAAKVAKDAIPFIRGLLAENQVEDAEQVLDLIEDIDLDGTGKLLGNTSAARSVLAGLKAQVRSHDSTEAEIRRRQNELDNMRLVAQSEMLNVLAEEDGPLSDNRIDELVSQFRAKNPELPPGADTVYRELLEKDQATDPDSVAAVESLVNQLDLSQAKEALSQYIDSGAIGVTEALDLTQHIQKVENLVAPVVDPRLRQNVEFQLFPPSQLGDGSIQPAFEGSETFYELTSAEQNQAKTKIMDFWFERFKARAFKAQNLAELQAGQQKFASEAFQETLDYAKQEMQAMKKAHNEVIIRDRIKSGVDAADQVQTISSELDKFIRSQVRTLPDGSTAGDLLKTLVKKTEGEKKPLFVKGAAFPLAGSDERFKEAYMVIKPIFGFSAEEILTGETVDGIEFDSSNVSWRSVPVFGSMKELNDGYNNGDPTADWLSVAYTVTGDEEGISAAEFYRTQRDLITGRSSAVAELTRQIRNIQLESNIK